MSFSKLKRLPLMALAVAALLLAMWGGLQRLGLSLPVIKNTLPYAHGPLMIGGFLGTLISLERAVAIGRGWAFGAPLLTGLGGILLISGLQPALAALMITAGSVILLTVFVAFIRRQNTIYMHIMALGTLCWLGGNLFWLGGQPFYRIVLLWAGFLIFTIAGERLELSRLVQLTSQKRNLFLTAAAITLLGIVLQLYDASIAWRIFGAGLMALTLWLYRYDIVRRTVKKDGLTRFIAVSLLSGYFWLGVSGILAVVFGSLTAGPQYDALLHAIFLGFVFSMIFGHAPVIFPAVLNVPIAYRSRFYIHLALLHLSLLIRIVGDLIGTLHLRQWGAAINVIAILLFFANTVSAALAAKLHQTS